MAKPKLHFQRFEFKYYLPKNKVDRLIPVLLKYLKRDPHTKSKSGFYSVNSLYFDNYDFDCFWDKESGVGKRKKLRLRFYDEKLKDDTLVYAELKRKHDALVIKDRIKLTAIDCLNNNFDRRLIGLYRQDKEDSFLKELIWFKKRYGLRPKVFVSYKRQAYAGNHGSQFRVTLDYDIKAQLASGLDRITDKLKDVYPAGVVLEIKYNNVLPAWFGRVIQKYQLERLAYSKYGNSLRSLIPDLDDNNYSII